MFINSSIRRSVEIFRNKTLFERHLNALNKGAQPGEFQDPFLLSSVARELQALSSHTIHHFAVMAMTLRQRVSQLLSR
jgi:hypothetical protein